MIITVFNAISHFLVDAACVAGLYSFGVNDPDFGTAVLVYNTVAFSTQCLVGLLLDRIVRQGRRRSDAALLYGSIQACAMFVAAAAALYTFTPIITAVLLGIGNSVFHVSGGTVSLDRSKGKAAPLGVFVAPGAFGVTVGVLFPKALDYIGLALGVAAILCFGVYRRFAVSEEMDAAPAEKHTRPQSFGPIIALTAAVAVRAIGGSAVDFTWKAGAAQALLLTLCVFLGKFFGGFVCDRFGASKMSVPTVIVSAILIAFFAWSMPLSLIGQLLLNLSMPVTLWLLYRHLPDRPGLAFGLAASALWPGTLIGGLIKFTGPLQSVLIIVCFLLSLGAIMYSERVLGGKK